MDADAALGVAELRARLRGAGSGHALSIAPGQGAPVLLDGDCLAWNFADGLSVHVTDAVARTRFEARMRLPPALSVTVMLAGDVSASLDGCSVRMSAHGGARIYLWAYEQPIELCRAGSPGDYVRKVVVAVPRDWFRALPGRGRRAAAPYPGHLCIESWPATRDLVLAAERALAATRCDDMLSRIVVERSALDILIGGLSRLREPPRLARPRASGRDAARAQAVRRVLDAHPGGPLPLTDIARAAAMSVSTMQRTFREHYGTSVIDYVRARRLDRARDALAAGELSVRQAATLAGYATSTGFATAFRRHFGCPPSHCIGRASGA